jgi:peptidoglycan hydrolase-like protein with peptidoglycan-binding domain
VPFAELYARDGAGGGPGWAPYGGRTPDVWQFASTALIPGVRGGQAGADINAYRGDLPALVQLLAGDTTTPAPQTGDPMLTHWTTLVRGSTGDAVRVAQGLLLARRLPVGSASGQPDGDFGPTTEQSTRALQQRAGITVDGEFGPHTLSVALYGRDLA